MRMPASRLFTPPADFAPTEPAIEFEGRRPSLRLFGCGCGKHFLQRASRSWWMRLLPRFRLYLCIQCGHLVLRWRIRQQHVYSALYLQAMIDRQRDGQERRR